jgi:GTP cyclohydrolase IA
MASAKAAVRVIRSKPTERPAAPLTRELLEQLGEDSQRDGLDRTPERVGEALRFLTSGYQMDIQRIVNGALYQVKYDEMVVVKDIEFFSLCEHHMLPFFGRMHVAYLPKGKVIGLSKIPRIVDMFPDEGRGAAL